jgi:hypothetical protein
VKTVNPYLLHTLLEPITGLADDDDAVIRYSGIDPNDELEVKRVIRDLIVPHSQSLSEAASERIKLSYQYYLSQPESDFGRVYDSNLCPFDAPDDPRLFFVWIWEECFPGEAYSLENLNEFTVVSDVSETQ